MKKKIITTFLFAASLLFGTSTSAVYAQNDVYTSPTDSANVTVTATVDSEFMVSIPQTMELNQVSKGVWQYEYSIDVDATISANQYVSVVPTSEVELEQTGKDSVYLTVTQQAQKFRASDYKGVLAADEVCVDATDATPEATGLITVKDGYKLTTGYWEGTLSFEISLVDETP